jgi:protein-tyrosine phosphatase
MVVSVLMVCAGNICRSPMAEGVFRQLVHEAGLDGKISVDSAGTSGYHVGQNPHQGTMTILQEKGIKYTGRSRQLTRLDLEKFDYILAMDDENLADIRWLAGDGEKVQQVKIARLLDFAPELSVREVPDPYYSGGFPGVYDLVLAGSRGLLAHIRKDHHI